MEKMVIIVEKGKVKVDLEGFVGSGCMAVQEAMEKAVGKTTSSKKKPEFDRVPARSHVANRG